MKEISNRKMYQEALAKIIFGHLAGMALKLDKVGPVFSSFNPCPSLLSFATDDRKQFQYAKYSLQLFISEDPCSLDKM